MAITAIPTAESLSAIRRYLPGMLADAVNDTHDMSRFFAGKVIPANRTVSVLEGKILVHSFNSFTKKYLIATKKF